MIDLEIDYSESIPVAKLAGEIDLSQAAILRERLTSVVQNDGAGLVIDLTETRYIDSAVVNVMFELADRMSGHQLRLGVVVPEGGLVERVLSIVDLASVAELQRTVDAAVAAVRAGA